MNGKIGRLFDNKKLVEKIKKKLPYLFQLAELECPRVGKPGPGPEVGSVREKIIIAILLSAFGSRNVKSTIPTTESEVDVNLFGKPISIKTKTTKPKRTRLDGIKLKWTADNQKAMEASKKYFPSCDMIFVHIKWNDSGALYYIPKRIQTKTLSKIKRKNYIEKLKTGANNRGVEITSYAMKLLINDPNTKRIEIDWKWRENYENDFNSLAFERWKKLWEKR